jgi:hypothetical protein
MEEIGIREVAHETGDMSKHTESLVDMVRQEFHIGCLSIGFAECSIRAVVPSGVLLVRRDILFKFVLWTLAPNTQMSLTVMRLAILRAICKPCC